MTADEVLEFLRADYRVRAGLDFEVEGGEELDADTTIATWRNVCDLQGTRSLARTANAWFGAACSTREWRRVLEPESTRTLGELASFVAAHASWPTFTPAMVGGASDPACGAFIALQHAIADAGGRRPRVRPSTSISDLRTRQLLSVLQLATKLAPEIVPEPKLRPSGTRVRWILGAVAIGCGIGAYLVRSAVAGALGGMIALLAGGIVLEMLAPRKVDLPGYDTIGDLARAIAQARHVAA